MKKFLFVLVALFSFVATVDARRAYVTELTAVSYSPLLMRVSLDDGLSLQDYRYSPMFAAVSVGDEVEYTVSGNRLINFVNISKEFDYDIDGNYVRVRFWDWQNKCYTRGNGRIVGSGSYSGRGYYGGRYYGNGYYGGGYIDGNISASVGGKHGGVSVDIPLGAIVNTIGNIVQSRRAAKAERNEMLRQSMSEAEGYSTRSTGMSENETRRAAAATSSTRNSGDREVKVAKRPTMYNIDRLSQAF